MAITPKQPNVPSLKDAVTTAVTTSVNPQRSKGNLKLVGVAWEVKGGALQVQLKGLEGSVISFSPGDVLRLVIFRAKIKRTDKSPTHLVYIDEQSR